MLQLGTATGHGDRDHVVVGPGGVVLVETKWGGTPWDVNGGGVLFQRALDQTARNAGQLALWHGFAKHGRPGVQPVLAVWGPPGATCASCQLVGTRPAWWSCPANSCRTGCSAKAGTGCFWSR